MAKKAPSTKNGKLKVVELGEFITAPFCAKLFADTGAEVIKVEKPGAGDKARRHGPFPDDVLDHEKSGLFLTLNTNKMGITLDVKNPGGKKIFKELLKDADILIENNTPIIMEEMGLDYASLKDEFPMLVMVSITPFGQTGPYRNFKAHSINLGAHSGMVSMVGDPSREPMSHPLSWCEYAAGLGGATSGMIALFARDVTGIGRHVDVAASHNLNAHMSAGIAENSLLFGTGAMRTGHRTSTTWYPCTILPLKDGNFVFYTFTWSHWERLIEILGNPEWSKDPRFAKAGMVFALAPHGDELDALLTGELEKWTKQDLFEKCYEAKIPFVPVMDVKDVVENPQLNYHGEITEIEHPSLGKIKFPVTPGIFSKTPIKIERHAPQLGEHNEEIYCNRMGYKKTELVELHRQGII